MDKYYTPELISRDATYSPIAAYIRESVRARHKGAAPAAVQGEVDVEIAVFQEACTFLRASLNLGFLEELIDAHAFLSPEDGAPTQDKSVLKCEAIWHQCFVYVDWYTRHALGKSYADAFAWLEAKYGQLEAIGAQLPQKSSSRRTVSAKGIENELARAQKEFDDFVTKYWPYNLDFSYDGVEQLLLDKHTAETYGIKGLMKVLDVEPDFELFEFFRAKRAQILGPAQFAAAPSRLAPYAHAFMKDDDSKHGRFADSDEDASLAGLAQSFTVMYV